MKGKTIAMILALVVGALVAYFLLTGGADDLQGRFRLNSKTIEPSETSNATRAEEREEPVPLETEDLK